MFSPLAGRNAIVAFRPTISNGKRIAMIARIASVAAVALLAGGVCADDVLRLADGSRVVGSVASETAASLEFSTRYGTLSIPKDDIRERTKADEKAAADERWILAAPPAEARLARSIAVARGAGETFSLPVEGRVEAVRGADGRDATWRAVEAGGLTLLSVEVGAATGDRIEVEAAVANPLRPIADSPGGFAFSRTYAPEEAGTLRIEFELPEGWTTNLGAADGDGVVVEKSLRRQEHFVLDAEFAIGR